MSAARQKGTRAESELLPKLRQVFGPQVERAPLKGTLDAGDYVGVPFPVECKSTKTFLLREWVGRLRKVVKPVTDQGRQERWALCYHDDRRKAGCVGDVMVLPLDFGMSLLHDYFNSEPF